VKLISEYKRSPLPIFGNSKDFKNGGDVKDSDKDGGNGDLVLFYSENVKENVLQKSLDYGTKDVKDDANREPILDEIIGTTGDLILGRIVNRAPGSPPCWFDQEFPVHAESMKMSVFQEYCAVMPIKRRIVKSRKSKGISFVPSMFKEKETVIEIETIDSDDINDISSTGVEPEAVPIHHIFSPRINKRIWYKWDDELIVNIEETVNADGVTETELQYKENWEPIVPLDINTVERKNDIYQAEPWLPVTTFATNYISSTDTDSEKPLLALGDIQSINLDADSSTVQITIEDLSTGKPIIYESNISSITDPNQQNQLAAAPKVDHNSIPTGDFNIDMSFGISPLIDQNALTRSHLHLKEAAIEASLNSNKKHTATVLLPAVESYSGVWERIKRFAACDKYFNEEDASVIRRSILRSEGDSDIDFNSSDLVTTTADDPNKSRDEQRQENENIASLLEDGLHVSLPMFLSRSRHNEYTPESPPFKLRNGDYIRKLELFLPLQTFEAGNKKTLYDVSQKAVEAVLGKGLGSVDWQYTSNGEERTEVRREFVYVDTDPRENKVVEIEEVREEKKEKKKDKGKKKSSKKEDDKEAAAKVAADEENELGDKNEPAVKPKTKASKKKGKKKRNGTSSSDSNSTETIEDATAIASTVPNETEEKEENKENEEQEKSDEIKEYNIKHVYKITEKFLQPAENVVGHVQLLTSEMHLESPRKTYIEPEIARLSAKYHVKQLHDTTNINGSMSGSNGNIVSVEYGNKRSKVSRPAFTREFDADSGLSFDAEGRVVQKRFGIDIEQTSIGNHVDEYGISIPIHPQTNLPMKPLGIDAYSSHGYGNFINPFYPSEHSKAPITWIYSKAKAVSSGDFFALDGITPVKHFYPTDPYDRDDGPNRYVSEDVIRNEFKNLLGNEYSNSEKQALRKQIIMINKGLLRRGRFSYFSNVRLLKRFAGMLAWSSARELEKSQRLLRRYEHKVMEDRIGKASYEVKSNYIPVVAAGDSKSSFSKSTSENPTPPAKQLVAERFRITSKDQLEPLAGPLAREITNSLIKARAKNRNFPLMRIRKVRQWRKLKREVNVTGGAARDFLHGTLNGGALSTNVDEFMTNTLSGMERSTQVLGQVSDFERRKNFAKFEACKTDKSYDEKYKKNAAGKGEEVLVNSLGKKHDVQNFKDCYWGNCDDQEQEIREREMRKMRHMATGVQNRVQDDLNMKVREAYKQLSHKGSTSSDGKNPKDDDHDVPLSAAFDVKEEFRSTPGAYPNGDLPDEIPKDGFIYRLDFREGIARGNLEHYQCSVEDRGSAAARIREDEANVGSMTDNKMMEIKRGFNPVQLYHNEKSIAISKKYGFQPTAKTGPYHKFTTVYPKDRENHSKQNLSLKYASELFQAPNIVLEVENEKKERFHLQFPNGVGLPNKNDSNPDRWVLSGSDDDSICQDYETDFLERLHLGDKGYYWKNPGENSDRKIREEYVNEEARRRFVDLYGEEPYDRMKSLNYEVEVCDTYDTEGLRNNIVKYFHNVNDRVHMSIKNCLDRDNCKEVQRYGGQDVVSYIGDPFWSQYAQRCYCIGRDKKIWKEHDIHQDQLYSSTVNNYYTDPIRINQNAIDRAQQRQQNPRFPPQSNRIPQAPRSNAIPGQSQAPPGQAAMHQRRNPQPIEYLETHQLPDISNLNPKPRGKSYRLVSYDDELALYNEYMKWKALGHNVAHMETESERALTGWFIDLLFGEEAIIAAERKSRVLRAVRRMRERAKRNRNNWMEFQKRKVLNGQGSTFQGSSSIAGSSAVISEIYGRPEGAFNGGWDGGAWKNYVDDAWYRCRQAMRMEKVGVSGRKMKGLYLRPSDTIFSSSKYGKIDTSIRREDGTTVDANTHGRARGNLETQSNDSDQSPSPGPNDQVTYSGSLRNEIENWVRELIPLHYAYNLNEVDPSWTENDYFPLSKTTNNGELYYYDDTNDRDFNTHVHWLWNVLGRFFTKLYNWTSSWFVWNTDIVNRYRYFKGFQPIQILVEKFADQYSATINELNSLRENTIWDRSSNMVHFFYNARSFSEGRRGLGYQVNPYQSTDSEGDPRPLEFHKTSETPFTAPREWGLWKFGRWIVKGVYSIFGLRNPYAAGVDEPILHVHPDNEGRVRGPGATTQATVEEKNKILKVIGVTHVKLDVRTIDELDPGIKTWMQSFLYHDGVPTKFQLYPPYKMTSLTREFGTRKRRVRSEDLGLTVKRTRNRKAKKSSSSSTVNDNTDNPLEEIVDSDIEDDENIVTTVKTDYTCLNPIDEGNNKEYMNNGESDGNGTCKRMEQEILNHPSSLGGAGSAR